MNNFSYTDPDGVYFKLTNDFREFKEYLFQNGRNVEDLKLCTIVLEDLATFIVKNYKGNKHLLKKR